MRQAKQYTIITHTTRGNTHETTGTLQELKEHFGFTKSVSLQAGDYWHSKTVHIAEPKSIKSLMRAIERENDVRYRCCYDRPYYELKAE